VPQIKELLHRPTVANDARFVKRRVVMHFAQKFFGKLFSAVAREFRRPRWPPAAFFVFLSPNPAADASERFSADSERGVRGR
jgi:hypothetical protein